eukprot:CAMPEP_0118926410 /NCGR_PEP_ID=MMETSP1169-20130426/4096_1 /TAXON_ID=36882 /ORGANISM="Pyramimonas obovata, Strain CCMP722" /LENGTH=201 /DNA_ID=CAMNT_0006867949 /DNA_START=77 /DNA_END=682 /DNA_ORIENTATION=-
MRLCSLVSNRDFVGLTNFLKGVSVNSCMIGGVTPLQIAVEKHDVEMVAYLLSMGAEPNQETGGQGKPTAIKLAKELHQQAQASNEMIAKTADVVKMFEDEKARGPIMENLQITIDDGVRARRQADALFATRLLVLLGIAFCFWLLIMRHETLATTIFGPDFVLKTQRTFNSTGARFQDGLKRGIWKKINKAVNKITSSMTS